MNVIIQGVKMKKKIIFIVHNLRLGGAQKSLISLLENLDYSKLDVDLMVLDHSGLDTNNKPSQVKLLPQNNRYRAYLDSEYKSIRALISQKKYILLLWKISAKSFGVIKGVIYSKRSFLSKSAIIYSWDFYKLFLPKISGQYDISVGLGGTATYVAVDKIRAKRKIAWIHTDYKTYCRVHNMSSDLDRKYFNVLDRVILVTNSNKEAFDDVFPNYSNKSIVIDNVISIKKIRELSIEPIKDRRFKTDILTIVTVARIEPAKALDRIPQIIAKLKEHSLPFRWYIIGDGAGRSRIEELIEEYNISDQMIILGFKENPYPYIRTCDIFALPSLYEGKSITLDEAKILYKPIITTNYPSSSDSILNRWNGLIVDNSVAGIYEGIKELICNPDLRDKFSYNLQNDNFSDMNGAEKFMELIEFL